MWQEWFEHLSFWHEKNLRNESFFSGWTKRRLYPALRRTDSIRPRHPSVTSTNFSSCIVGNNCSCKAATLEWFAKQQHNFSVNPVSPPDSTVETSKHLSSRHDAPGADLVVGVTGEEGLAIGGPGERDTLRLSALLANLDVLGLELVNLALLLEIEDDDARGGGGAQPVAVGGEDQGVDLITGVERVEVLALVQVPEHGGTVLATGSAKGTVGGDGDGVDVAGVTDVVSLDAASGELPNLFSLVSAFIHQSVASRCEVCGLCEGSGQMGE